MEETEMSILYFCFDLMIKCSDYCTAYEIKKYERKFPSFQVLFNDCTLSIVTQLPLSKRELGIKSIRGTKGRKFLHSVSFCWCCVLLHAASSLFSQI